MSWTELKTRFDFNNLYFISPYCSYHELMVMDAQEGEEKFQTKLKQATWGLHLFRVSVALQEYMSERRQRITIRGLSPVDGSAESKYLLEEIAKVKLSPL